MYPSIHGGSSVFVFLAVMTRHCFRFGLAHHGEVISGRATLEEARCRESLLQNDLFLKHQ